MQSVLPKGLDFLIDYKFFIFLVLIAVAAAFSRKFIGFMLYIFAYPLIIVFWKIPKVLYSFRSWLVVLAIVDALVSIFIHIRRKIVITTGVILSLLVIVVSNNQIALACAGIVILVTLCLTLIVTVINSFRTSYFFKQQLKGVKYVVNSKIFSDMTLLNDKFKNDQKKLTVEESSQIMNSIQFNLIGQRVLYFWAYQLEKYSKSSSSYLLNGCSYIWLSVKVILLLTFINLAIFKIDPNQFTVTSPLNFVKSFDYTLNSIVLSETSHTIATEDVALVFRVFSELIGMLILGSFIANLWVAKVHKKNADLEEVVGMIKDEGTVMEKRFANEFQLTPNEAIEKLSQLQGTMLLIINKISSQFPDNYFSKKQG